MNIIKLDELENYLTQNTKILDVRADIEFIQGSLPNSVNIPILNDQERAQIGTIYKQQGREIAIKSGHRIVSGENKQAKINAWKNFIHESPQAILTCFRGGLRSQITQSFLVENGINILRIDGGYKAVRQFYIDEIEKNVAKDKKIKILTGETGSGKTILIEKNLNLRTIDLEKHAAHRGSAFGQRRWPQPAQATFENCVAHDFLKHRLSDNSRSIIMEDESRLIGSRHLPENLFAKIREAPVVQMVLTLEERTQNIFNEYITNELDIYDLFEAAMNKIQKKMGGLRTSEIITDIKNAKTKFVENQDLNANKIWIEKLLVWYYDPMYRYSFQLRKPVVEFKGTCAEVEAYLAEL
jgi:tRNA 2-selenouridine synthase